MGPPNLNLLFVDSKKDFGSAFYFYLQRCALNAATIPITNFRAGRDKKNKCSCNSILIVDDEQFNLSVMQSLIRTFGYHCDLAYNGEEAVQKVKDKFIKKCNKDCCLFPIIFMDLNMPKMTGWQATSEIRSFEKENSISMKQTIVAISGFNMEEEKEKCI